MSFSLDIKVIEAHENISNFFPYKDIEVITDNGGIYEYNFSNQLVGTWYTLGIKKNDIFWALDLIDTDFDKKIELDSERWIHNQSVLENITPLYFVGKYRKSLLEVLLMLLASSSKNMILLLPHYQGAKYEIVQGPISFDEFIKNLDEGLIPFNVATIIKKYE